MMTVFTLAAHILKIGMTQRKLAWSLSKDDMQIKKYAGDLAVNSCQPYA